MMAKKVAYVFAVGFALSSCAIRDSDYAGRNDLEYARNECLRVAQSNGYNDVAVDGVERDGSAEWKVKLRMHVEGKEVSKPNAANTTPAPIALHLS